MSLVEVVSALCLFVGGLFGVIGAIGALRFPDFFTRLHAASLTDTLCAGLIILGLMLQAGSWLVAIKLLLVLFFLLFTAPTATHALARAALRNGYRPNDSREPGNG